MQAPNNKAKTAAIRDGVGASSVLLPTGDWPRVLDFLCERFAAISADTWRSRMQRGLVLDAAGDALAADAPYAAGTTIHYYRELEHELQIPFEAQILYRDAHLLIADKPHFLPVIPSGRFVQQSLLVRLKRETALDSLSPLHRIDRGTAGIVAFSIDPATRGAYQQLFAQRAVEKHYEAIAPWRPDLSFPFSRQTRIVRGQPFFRSMEVEGAPNCETLFASAEPDGARARYHLRPASGKKHQLRVHMAAIGAPIENDTLYPHVSSPGADDYSRPLKLLARTLAFVDPLSGRSHRFESRRTL